MRLKNDGGFYQDSLSPSAPVPRIALGEASCPTQSRPTEKQGRVFAANHRSSLRPCE